jgi:large subunit ribosomal protein L4
MTRQGTASTKWRNEVHGSSRKIRPQKGTGSARLGDKKSPMLVGGGVAFGPHPRDFSTDLPRKIYDKAWRIALSYRYRRGELFIVNDNITMPTESSTHFLKKLFETHDWGKRYGRSLLITNEERPKLLRCAENIKDQGRILEREDVDVKDLLSLGRIIIEKSALDRILKEHSKDLTAKPSRA